jgi:hypothetical protein
MPSQRQSVVVEVALLLVCIEWEAMEGLRVHGDSRLGTDIMMVGTSTSALMLRCSMRKELAMRNQKLKTKMSCNALLEIWKTAQKQNSTRWQKLAGMQGSWRL